MTDDQYLYYVEYDEISEQWEVYRTIIDSPEYHELAGMDVYLYASFEDAQFAKSRKNFCHAWETSRLYKWLNLLLNRMADFLMRLLKKEKKND